MIDAMWLFVICPIVAIITCIIWYSVGALISLTYTRINNALFDRWLNRGSRVVHTDVMSEQWNIDNIEGYRSTRYGGEIVSPIKGGVEDGKQSIKRQG